MPDRLTILGSDETVDLSACTPVEVAGARLWRTPDGRHLSAAFRSSGVDLGTGPPPAPDDEEGLAELVLDWVEAVRAHDWSDLRGAPLEGDEDWIDLRTAMARLGWGPAAAHAAWQACRDRPYTRELPTAAGWAGGGWVVPAVADELEPAFARPVLEARGLLRWAYITRWADPVPVPDGALPTEAEPSDLGWADVLARLRQDHHTGASLTETEALCIELLSRAGLGPGNALEAEDEPLADRHLDAACTHPSAVVRAAAWWLLRAEADHWVACEYNECTHHWAVEAEEDAYELEEVLELAGYGVANPVDAAATRRRLLTLAYGELSDVPLVGAGDIEDFLAFYEGWLAHGRPEEAIHDAAAELRGDEDPPGHPPPPAS